MKISSKGKYFIFLPMLALCIAGATAQTGMAAASRIYIPQPNYTFSNQIEGAEIVHDFVVMNQGDADLDILNIKTG